MHCLRLALPLAALLAGCTTLPAPPPAPAPPAGDPLAACRGYLAALDREVAEQRVGDAGASRLAGFAHLRSTRFLASFAGEALSRTQLEAWVERLRRRDAEARRIELANLAAPRRAALARLAPLGGDHLGSVRHCGRALSAVDLRDEQRLRAIRARARVPDDYRDWQRVAGLYPLTHVFALHGVRRLHAGLRTSFSGGPLPVRDALHRYRPGAGPTLSAAAAARLLRASAANPLGIPEPGPAARAALFATHAPVWDIDVASDDDRIGRVEQSAAGGFRVDTGEPVVYQALSHTRWRGRALLQLNYMVWWPARTPEHPRDMYAGPFDGLIWRVTLLPDGTPLAYDSVHACGCYYLLFPAAPGLQAARAPYEPVLAPARIEPPAAPARLVIRIAARTHYLLRVTAETGWQHGAQYALAPYERLLSLEGAAGTRRSLFSPDGLLHASAREERHVFWPFGIASAGAMRRLGTHAIAFVGVRHFDDADLLDGLLR